jgi:hypothetical protein
MVNTSSTCAAVLALKLLLGICVLVGLVLAQSGDLGAESITINVDHNINGEFMTRGRFNVPIRGGGKLLSGNEHSMAVF